MKCPYCSKSTKITNSRKTNAGYEKWRRHSCSLCGKVFTTIEAIDTETTLTVIKRNNRLEPFMASKMIISIYKALDHRLDAQEIAGRLTKNIYVKLLPRPTKQVYSSEISERVINTLKSFDPASAVKYQASQTPRMNRNDIRKVLK